MPGYSRDAWPRNVRELEHTIERAVALTDERTINEIDLILSTPQRLSQRGMFHQAKTRAVARFERAYIKDLLLAHRGNITKAAQAAGKNNRAFWQPMRKHGSDAQTSPVPKRHTWTKADIH